MLKRLLREMRKRFAIILVVINMKNNPNVNRIFVEAHLRGKDRSKRKIIFTVFFYRTESGIKRSGKLGVIKLFLETRQPLD